MRLRGGRSRPCREPLHRQHLAAWLAALLLQAGVAASADPEGAKLMISEILGRRNLREGHAGAAAISLGLVRRALRRVSHSVARARRALGEGWINPDLVPPLVLATPTVRVTFGRSYGELRVPMSLRTDDAGAGHAGSAADNGTTTWLVHAVYLRNACSTTLFATLAVVGDGNASSSHNSSSNSNSNSSSMHVIPEWLTILPGELVLAVHTTQRYVYPYARSDDGWYTWGARGEATDLCFHTPTRSKRGEQDVCAPRADTSAGLDSEGAVDYTHYFECPGR